MGTACPKVAVLVLSSSLLARVLACHSCPGPATAVAAAVEIIGTGHSSASVSCQRAFRIPDLPQGNKASLRGGGSERETTTAAKLTRNKKTGARFQFTLSVNLPCGQSGSFKHKNSACKAGLAKYRWHSSDDHGERGPLRHGRGPSHG